MTLEKPSELDIRSDHCPITFVKARIFLEQLPVPSKATIYFAGQEVCDSLPHSLRSLGYHIDYISELEKEGEFIMHVSKGGEQ